MGPEQLLAPTTTIGAPAPYWLLVALKALGFTLHIAVMHLWFAGIVLALGWRAAKGGFARTLGGRLLNQMPLIISLGVNLGIVPLLFLQVSYYKVFYPTTILMAWPWLSIVALLMVAYYGVYYYVTGLRAGHLTRLHHVSGWVAAVLFIAIGFLFSSGMSLMERVDLWPQLWQGSSVAGAPLGLAMHVGPGTVARWAMMLGLAVTTVAVWTVLDSALFAGKESPDYRRWAAGIGAPLYLIGLIAYVITGSLYVFATWPNPLKQEMFSGGHLILTVLTAVGPGLALLLVLRARRAATPLLAVLTGIAQLGALALSVL